MKTPKEFLETALGGNMNTSTLTLNFWEEIMADYAKYVSSQLEPLKKNAEGLLPCPFCGDESEIIRVGGEYYPMCKGSRKSMCYANRLPVKGIDGFRHKKDAIEIWNKRATASA